MSQITNISKTLPLALLINALQSISAHAADEKVEANKFHINITKSENGREVLIDSTFFSKDELKTFLKENKIEEPDTTALMDFLSSHQQGRKNIEEKIFFQQDSKSSGEKHKHITIIEKEDGNNTGKTDLDIKLQNYSPEERAGIIQEMLDMKNTGVEIQQMYTTGLENDTTLINKPPKNGIPSIETISSLQIFPNPSKGRFHISLKTSQPITVNLRLVDNNGREFYNEVIKGVNGTFEKNIHPLPAISPGSYILEALTSGEKITRQIVAQ